MRQISNKTEKLKIDVAKGKAVSVAAALIVSCFLPFAIDKSLGYPRDFQSEPAPASFNQPDAAPSEFPLPSRKFNVEAKQTNFGRGATGPIEYLSFPRDLTGALAQVNFELAVVHTITPITSVVPQANSHPQRSTQSPRISAFYGLPRRLETDVDRISFDNPSLAPMAFVRFCTKYPRDCEIHRMAFSSAADGAGGETKG